MGKLLLLLPGERCLLGISIITVGLEEGIITVEEERESFVLLHHLFF